MKEEVRKILEMSKAGTITDEQAAQLLEELSQEREAGPRRRSATGSGMETFANLIGGVVPEWVSTSKATGFNAEALADNSFVMSKVKGPDGEGFEFRGNSLKMSHLESPRLERSQMNGNSFSMCKIAGVSLRDGKWNGSRLTASHVDGVSAEASEIEGLEAAASKIGELKLKGSSALRGAVFDHSHVRQFGLDERSVCELLHVTVSHLRDVSVTRSELRDWDGDACKLFALKIDGSQWQRVLMRMTRLDGVQFAGTRFQDVLFTGEKEGMWKRCGFENVRFENVTLAKTLLSHCHWKNVTLKNIELTDHKILNSTLRDVTLDGNEQLLQALSAGRERQSAS